MELNLRITTWLLVLLCCGIHLEVCKCQPDLAPEIIVNPSSILIPLNVRADFECTVRCESGCVITWYIEDYATSHQHQKMLFMEKGFIFSDTLILTDGLHKNVLSVNTSDINVNNTLLYCNIRNIHDRQTATSNIANLLLISGSPLTTNPYVDMEPSLSHLSLKWSPPYLWPGRRIQYYSVTTTANTNGNTTVTDYNAIEAAYTDVVVMLPISYDEQMCIEFSFEVYAVSSSNETLRSFVVMEKTERAPFDDVEIDSTTVFTANVTPIVRMEIKLPSTICDYQDLNYTVIIAGGINESDIVERGPFYHQGPGSVQHDIESVELIRNEEYSVMIVVSTYFNSTFSFPGSKIDTTFLDEYSAEQATYSSCIVPGIDHHSYRIHYYKLTIDICVSIILLLLIILSLVILYLFIKWRWNKKGSRRVPTCAERVNNALVPNPIYSNPVYTSVQPHFKALTLGTAANTSSPSASSDPCNSPVSTNSCDIEKSLRYVDQPSVKFSKFRSESFTLSACSPQPLPSYEEVKTPRCSSVSSSANKQTDKKSQFTLSLATGGPGNNGNCTGPGEAMNPKQVACVNKLFISESEEDKNYTLMSPAGGTMAASALCGGELCSEDVKEKYKE